MPKKNAVRGARKPYRHDLDGWFPRFAQNLKEAVGGNPMTQLLDADAEINPYFVTFALYWYRVPGRTVADRGHELARTSLARLRKLPDRLREDAVAIRWILTTAFPPPLGSQLQELTSQVSAVSSEDLESIAEACERGTEMLKNLYGIVKNQASGRRNSRNAGATILSLHLMSKMSKRKIGTILSILVDCADSAFRNVQRSLDVRTFEQARSRYEKLFPKDYQLRVGEATRSRGALSPEEATMWRRLNDDDCASIVESLRPRFDYEVGRATRP